MQRREVERRLVVVGFPQCVAFPAIGEISGVVREITPAADDGDSCKNVSEKAARDC